MDAQGTDCQFDHRQFDHRKILRFRLSPRRLRFALWVVGCWLLLVPLAAAQDAARTEPARTEPIASVLDATLHDCAMLSIDRALAVGDAGAILTTEDGGKQWRSLSTLRSEFNYYAIGFDEPMAIGNLGAGNLGAGNPLRSGLIVGGTVQPATGRSIGTVLITLDEGKTWTPSQFPGLPRLIGLQRIKHRHWVAWGDWSDHFGSALFESIDGGKSWSPRQIPCGHLQAVAIGGDGAALIVDRASRVFFARDGVDFRSVDIQTDQFHPIRFCKIQPKAGGWVEMALSYGTRSMGSHGNAGNSLSPKKTLRLLIVFRWRDVEIGCGWLESRRMRYGSRRIMGRVGLGNRQERRAFFWLSTPGTTKS